MQKMMVSIVVGIFVVLGSVWHAQAFFSRDQWFHPNNGGNGSNLTQTLVSGDIPQTTFQTTLETTITTSQLPTGGTEGYIDTKDILTTPPPTSVVPEPSTFLLVGSGLMGLVWKLRKRMNY